jgi:hypothetical protein
MGNTDEKETVSRREVLRLAGTAAAFCASFGFLHGSQDVGVVQDKHAVEDKHLQQKWEQAEIKWYSGSTLLHSSAIPSKVAKHLQANANAVVDIKLFQSGKLLKNLGTVQGKH